MQRTVVLSEGAANSDDVNLAHLFSSVNRKMMDPVDRKGNAQNFHVQIRTLCDHASNELRTTIKTANTGYVTKQAVKAWYRMWRQQFRDAGISLKSLGPYGSVFKPRLQNLAYASGGDHWGGTSIRTGEWNFSDIVTVPGTTSASTTDEIAAAETYDQYSLHLCGATVTTSGDGSGSQTRRFDEVGIINSWIGSRKGQPTSAVDADSVIEQDNPLVLARIDDAASEVLLDEVRDLQQDLAPYTEAQLDDLFTQAVVNHSAADSGLVTVSAPCGWLRLETSEAATVEITLLGISDM